MFVVYSYTQPHQASSPKIAPTSEIQISPVRTQAQPLCHTPYKNALQVNNNAILVKNESNNIETVQQQIYAEKCAITRSS